MAGSSTSRSARCPRARAAASRRRRRPGTTAASSPVPGTRSRPEVAVALEARRGAASGPARSRRRPSPDGAANRIGTSPPGPFRCGSTTCSTKPAATAASTALPPRSSTAMPAALASQWVEATMPWVPVSSGRVVNTCGLLVAAEVRAGCAGERRGAAVRSARPRRPRCPARRSRGRRGGRRRGGPATVTPTSGGTSTRQRSTATGQRVWKWQPDGGSSGLGRSPRSTTRVRARCADRVGHGRGGEQRLRVGHLRVAEQLLARGAARRPCRGTSPRSCR